MPLQGDLFANWSFLEIGLEALLLKRPLHFGFQNTCFHAFCRLIQYETLR